MSNQVICSVCAGIYPGRTVLIAAGIEVMPEKHKEGNTKKFCPGSEMQSVAIPSANATILTRPSRFAPQDKPMLMVWGNKAGRKVEFFIGWACIAVFVDDVPFAATYNFYNGQEDPLNAQFRDTFVLGFSQQGLVDTFIQKRRAVV